MDVNSPFKPPLVRAQKLGAGKLTRARQLRQEMTPAESVLWQLVRRDSLDGFHFRRQQIANGFILDFYCAKAGLAIELDGEVHRSQGEYDQARDRILRRRGIRIERLTNEDLLMRPDEAIRKIREWLATKRTSTPSNE